jgi:hypothetical protein
MYLTSETLVRALLIANDLLERMTPGDPASGRPVMSIEQLQDIVHADTAVAIEKHEAVFEATYLRGRLERYDGGKRAIIHIRANQEFTWKRFVSAKELVHIKIDGTEHFSPYGDQTLEELIRKGHFGAASLAPPGMEPVQSEVFSEIAALEVLYPVQLRLKDLDELEAKTTTRVQLAHRYGIPRNYAATALDPEYLRMIGAALQEVSAKGKPA